MQQHGDARQRAAARRKRRSATLESATESHPTSSSWDSAGIGASAGALLDTIMHGVLITDQAGRVRFINRAMERISGYSSNELIGHHVELLVPVGRRAGHKAYRELYGACGLPARTMGFGLDIRLRSKGGLEIAVDVALSPLKAGDETLVVAMVEDVAQRRRYEQEARERAVFLELAQAAILVRRFEDSRIVLWNQAAAEIYGFSSAEAVGSVSHTLLRTVFPDSQQAVDVQLATEGKWEGELQHFRKDGVRLVTYSRQAVVRDEQGTPVSVLEINRDVTHQRRSRALIEASYAVTRGVLSSTEGGMLMHLIASEARRLMEAELAIIAIGDEQSDYLFIEAADGAEAKTVQGLKLPAAQSLHGRALRERHWIVITDLQAAREEYPEIAEDAPARAAALVPVKIADRQIGVLSLRRATPFSIAECIDLNQFASTAAVAVNYARMHDDLRRVALLEERERIARDMHDGVIQSLFSLGLTLRGLAARSADSQVVERTAWVADHIDEVIEDLRSYIFDLRPAMLSRAGLADALRMLVSDLTNKSGVTFALKVDSQLVTAVGSEWAFLLMFVTEALSNVVRHAQAQACDVRLRLDGDTAVIEVEDDGRGFDVTSAQATGRGLRNIKERAGKRGGTVDVESQPGAGTRMRVSIPVSPASTATTVLGTPGGTSSGAALQ